MNVILIILEDNVQMWLVPGDQVLPLIAREQTVNNLIAIVSNCFIFLIFENFYLSFRKEDNVNI